MSKTKISIPSIQSIKTEDDFIKYQKLYTNYLRQKNERQSSDKDVKNIKKEIAARWIRAGIMDRHGNIKKRYEKVILPK